MAINYHGLAKQFIAEKYGSPSTLRYYREEWWIWTAGCYRVISDSNIRGFMSHWLNEVGERARVSAVRELRSAVIAHDDVVISDGVQMPLYIDYDGYDTSQNLLAFKDQIVDLDVLTNPRAHHIRRSPTPKWFSQVVLNYSYDMEARCPGFLAFLDKVVPDKTTQDVLQEWFGYCLTHDTDMRAMLILYGESGTGKSTLSNILEALVGPENRSAVPLEGFWDRFAAQQTIGKLVNFCGDSKKIDTLAEGVIKRFTGGDTLLVDRKYKDAIACKMTAKIMVATNTFPHIEDISDATWNRFLVVPMDVQIPEAEMDRTLLGSEKQNWPLRRELPGIFNWAIEGLKRLRANGRFTMSQQLVQAKAEARIDNCSVAQFIEERVKEDTTGNGPTVKQFMHEYMCFCEQRHFQVLSATSVGRLLRKAFPDMVKKQVGSRGCQQRHYIGIKMFVPRDA